jgi:hypothetical protein
MGADMPIYAFDQNGILRVEETTFGSSGFLERADLQRLLREKIDVITPNTLIISEEFGEWDESRRRIDLLGIDEQANLVVIELKRTEDGGHMDLQAIRYAAMVSTLTFDQAANEFGKYLARLGKEDQNPRAMILDFLGWDEPDEDQFAQDVRIVLASAEFSKELTSSVLWLVNHDIDIRCVRLKPYNLDGRLIVDVQQIIPLPEVEEYQIQVREKAQKERQSRASGPDFTRFDVRIGDELHPAMWKRNAVYLICKRICDKGTNPNEIAETLDWRPNRVWYLVDGTVNASEFGKLASQQASSGGQHFDPRRWFCDEGELVHFNGKTYAFSSQWGGKGWHRAMNALQEKYPQFKISFTPASD